MARKPDLNAAVESLVAAEVAKALAPYRGLFGRLEALFGATKAPRAARRTAASARPRRATRPIVGGKKALRLAKKFNEGQTVHYKQGRGTFEATVTGVDRATGLIALQRAKDGKKVARPATKVLA